MKQKYESEKQANCLYGGYRQQEQRLPHFLVKCNDTFRIIHEVLFKELRGYDDRGDKGNLRMRCHC